MVLRDDPPEHRRRIDLAGMATFTGAAGVLTYAMIRANDHGWASASTGALVACSMVGLVAFVMVQARSPHAMFDLSLLRNRSFVGVLVASLAVSLASFSALTYTSIWLQSVLGMTPIESGLTGLPLSVAIFATSAVLGRRLHGAHPGKVIGGGLLLIGGGGLLGFAFVRGGASWPSLVPGYLLIGIGAGLAIPASNATAMDAVPLQRAGMAGGSVRTVQQLGYAFGIALLGTVFAARAHQVLSSRGIPGAAAAAHAVAGGQSPLLLQAAPADTRAGLSQALHAAAVSGLQATLGLSGVVGLIAGCAVLVLIRRPAPAPGTAAQAPKAPAAQPAVLVGQVGDEMGTPLAGAVLVLLDPAGVVVARLATAGDGGFVLPTAPGEYVLAAWATGHQPRALPVDLRGRHELSIPLRRTAAPVVARSGARVPVSRPADR